MIVLFTNELPLVDSVKLKQELQNLNNVSIYVANFGNKNFSQEKNYILDAQFNIFGLVIN